MSILTKNQILKKIEEKEINFSPALDQFQIQGHSVDLRLGYTFIIHKNSKLTKKGREIINLSDIRPEQKRNLEVIELEEGQFFELAPGEHITVSSLESIKVPNDLMAVLYPRSSVNRRGISVDLTGIVDAGYEGQLIIPIRNNTAQIARIYPGERFCQIVFEELTEEIEPRKSRHHLKDVVDEPQKEDSAELDLIMDGKITELKKQHQI